MAAMLDSDKLSEFDGKECRLVVVGRSGSGKSSVVNTLLGEDLSKVCPSAHSQTTDAKLFCRPRFGVEVRVVDTPGLFDTRPEMTNKVVLSRLATTALLLAPGPHAVLLTLACGQRFTPEEKAVVDHLKDFFGHGVLKHTILVFTNGDALERRKISMEEYISQSPPELKTLLSDVSGRYVVMNNESERKHRCTAARDLLHKVSAMMRLGTESFFSCELFTKAEEQMANLDKATETKFGQPSDRARSSNASETISYMSKSASDISKMTGLFQTAKQDSADSELLKGIAADLIRLVSRKEVSDRRQEDIVRSLAKTLLGVKKEQN